MTHTDALEAAARALFNERFPPHYPSWDIVDESERNNARCQANAAIAAFLSHAPGDEDDAWFIDSAKRWSERIINPEATKHIDALCEILGKRSATIARLRGEVDEALRLSDEHDAETLDMRYQRDAAERRADAEKARADKAEDALLPFVSNDQWQALLLAIQKTASDHDPISVTVTRGQLMAARRAALPESAPKAPESGEV